jgi:hypothetical protein
MVVKTKLVPSNEVDDGGVIAGRGGGASPGRPER